MEKSIHLISGFDNYNNWGSVFDSYAVIADYGNLSQKEFIGTSNSCRFCGVNSNEKFQQNVAHTIPEFSGNKFLFSKDECKDCNSLFSKFESELAIHSQGMRAFLGIKGKKRYPKIKGNSHTTGWRDGTLVSTIHSNIENQKNKENGGELTLSLNIERDNFKTKEKMSMKMKFPKKGYSSFLAFKALMKMAYSIMPKKELTEVNFNKFIEFLLDKKMELPEEIYQPFFEIIHYTLPYGKREPFITLWKKKDKIAKDISPPNFFVLFGFGSIAYQIFLPFLDCDKKIMENNDFHFFLIPHFSLNKDKSGISINLINSWRLEKNSTK